MFPFGNSNAPPNDSVSIYLDYADPKKSDSWHACSQFALVLSNPTDPKVYVVSRMSSPVALVDRPRLILASDAHHRFIPEECDWGFTRFIDLKKIYHPQDGHIRPLVEDDCTEITVFVRVLKDPTGVLWHNFVKLGSFSLA